MDTTRLLMKHMNAPAMSRANITHQTHTLQAPHLNAKPPMGESHVLFVIPVPARQEMSGERNTYAATRNVLKGCLVAQLTRSRNLSWTTPSSILFVLVKVPRSKTRSWSPRMVNDVWLQLIISKAYRLLFYQIHGIE